MGNIKSRETEWAKFKALVHYVSRTLFRITGELGQSEVAEDIVEFRSCGIFKTWAINFRCIICENARRTSDTFA